MTPQTKIARLVATALLPATLLVACGGGGGGGGSSDSTASVPFSTAVAKRVDEIAVATVTAYAASLAFDSCSACISRDYAMAYIAAHDALNGIRRSYEPLIFTSLSEPTADPNAAVAAAMRAVFRATLPEYASVYESAYTEVLGAIADGSAKTRGVALGEAVAAAVLERRANDGAANDNTPPAGYVIPAGTTPSAAGRYAFTTGATSLAVPGWGAVTPFAIGSTATYASQITAPYGGDLTSAAYRADYEETRCTGAAVAAPAGCATVRADGDDAKARFWFENAPTMWNRIADTIATARGLDGAARIRLHALVSVAVADSLIVSYSAQYATDFWRPETAIRFAGLADGSLTADAGWQPLGLADSDRRTPASPSHPSGDVMAAGAAQAVLDSLIVSGLRGFDVTSSSSTGLTLHYDDFASAAQASADAQVKLGFNFRAATSDSLTVGRTIGSAIVAAKMRPL
ncbi:vanadium-dependent haloperoxidase [Derxia gummosa]|uniref:Vanadium-dependent haloperoxidase n=1 Tax=Derxia gummosa DSM 723 TaxID=1121388 RepID=A0A8B6X1K1_9BURK|nr:vanadium-dependent haloperoxidase [Derxia gummosa]